MKHLSIVAIPVLAALAGLSGLAWIALDVNQKGGLQVRRPRINRGLFDFTTSSSCFSATGFGFMPVSTPRLAQLNVETPTRPERVLHAFHNAFRIKSLCRLIRALYSLVYQ